MAIVNKSYIEVIRIDKYPDGCYVRVITAHHGGIDLFYKTEKECKNVIENIQNQLSNNNQFIYINE